jgi:hypothetical protein
MGYCHCSSCRSWSGGPVNAFSLWKPEAVRITSGAEHVAMFQKTEFSQRQYCAKCGGHLMTNHPSLGLVDVFAATLPTLEFTAGVHVNYADTRRPSQVEGLSEGVWWLRRARPGIRTANASHDSGGAAVQFAPSLQNAAASILNRYLPARRCQSPPAADQTAKDTAEGRPVTVMFADPVSSTAPPREWTQRTCC